MNLTSDAEIECALKRKGLTAPRLTPDYLKTLITSAEYYVFPNTTTTVCCITLQNGFTVIGESACASPENFDKQIGESIAYTNAFDKLWVLEGYLLKQKLYEIAK